MGNATSQSKNTGNESFLTTYREPLLGLLDKFDEQKDLEVLGKQVRRKRSSKEKSSAPVGRSVIYKGNIPTRLLQGRGKGGDSNDDVSDSDVLAEDDVSLTTTVAIRRLTLGEESEGREDYWVRKQSDHHSIIIFLKTDIKD